MKSKSGFTLLEVLVASLLLGMLVSILTMLFNQSSVAWRIGTRGVYDLDQMRCQLANNYIYAESVLPFLVYDSNSDLSDNSTLYRVISPWGKVTSINSKPNINQRAIMPLNGLYNFPNNSFNSSIGRVATLSGSGESNGSTAYTVGITSAGPDHKFGTADDISTWPKKGE